MPADPSSLLPDLWTITNGWSARFDAAAIVEQQKLRDHLTDIVGWSLLLPMSGRAMPADHTSLLPGLWTITNGWSARFGAAAII